METPMEIDGANKTEKVSGEETLIKDLKKNSIKNNNNSNSSEIIKTTQVIDDDDDVVVILDEEEIAVPQRNRKTKPDSSQQELTIIDLVDKGSVNTKCINYACKGGEDFMKAPKFCLNFYRVKSGGKKKQEICRQCFDQASEHYHKLSNAFKKGNNLFECEMPVRSEMVEIDDSDSEGENEEISEANLNFDEDTINFLINNLDRVFNGVTKKHKMVDHFSKAVESLKERGRIVKESYESVDHNLQDVRKVLDRVYNNLYSEFQITRKELPAIDIDDSTCLNKIMFPRSLNKRNQVEATRHSLRNKQISNNKPEASTNKSNKNHVDSDPKDQPELIEAIEIERPPVDLPPKGAIQKPSLISGDVYYAARFAAMFSWVKVRLVNIVKTGTLVNSSPATVTKYLVTVDGTQSKTPVNRMVTGKEIAYATPSPVMLEVGTRVIALFKDPTTSTPKKSKKEAYYPGIVAEPLMYTNKYRYLIFFDDGYAQYVQHSNVHIIYESSKDVWDDMHVDSRPFIKKYLQTYPERPMVKLRKDQSVRTEYNGKWWIAIVLNVDCSLAQMFFEHLNRVEWIYRGSTRLNPMYKEELAATTGAQGKPRIPKQVNETGPYVQYTRPSKEEENIKSEKLQIEDIQPVRAVARKSTSRPSMPPINPKTVPFLPISGSSADKINTTLLQQPPSKVVYFTPRAQANTKTLYKPHKCSPSCLNFLTYDVKKLKGYNPLSKPLLCGWNRVTYKHKGKREINYKAPCGRFLRTMEELHRYLQITKSEMTVDLFDFDFWVHCLAEFVLEQQSTINKDMSNGLENVTIPVVNYVDGEDNNFKEYSNVRMPTEGVNMNLDPEFLSGCDCEDDCEDKSKCACWQLTLQGLPYLGKDAKSVGYVYRRLPEPVVTGIYECNSRCKCSSTCLNRVAQNPLQLKLQVFKTYNKGWGIRCLNDIPQGAFICIYAGNLLTEQMANEGGKNYGDEYLAELDYIEVVEKVKEDYEDEAKEDEQEDGKSQESADDEEEEEPVTQNSRSGRKKGLEHDSDFVPYFLVQKGKNSQAYKSRLRKRDTDNGKQENSNRKEDEEEEDTVTISDDEDGHEPSSFNPKTDADLEESRPSLYKSVREMFGKDECVYIMDAKVTGNIGRYLNHSCSPNVFVQNVFVDTHDLRFPWVAFFALTYIRAGTELTWNYNYDVGSVPGKIMYCHCGSQDCRGRLL